MADDILAIYLSEDEQWIKEELEVLSKETSVPLSDLAKAPLKACIEDLKKQVPKKRKVLLNGMEIPV